MFGSRLNRWTPLIVLLALCGYIVRLHQAGDINLYIHPRYNLFAVSMIVVAIVALAGGFLQQKSRPKRTAKKSAAGAAGDVIVVVLVALAFVVPARQLSSESINRRSLNTTNVGSSSSSSVVRSRDCPSSTPTSIQQWVTSLSTYVIDCFEGAQVDVQGFIYDTQSEPLPDGYAHIARVVLSCCVVDAQPFAMVLSDVNNQNWPLDTWLHVRGTLQSAAIGGVTQLVIQPNSVTELTPPDQPYDFIGS